VGNSSGNFPEGNGALYGFCFAVNDGREYMEAEGSPEYPVTEIFASCYPCHHFSEITGKTLIRQSPTSIITGLLIPMISDRVSYVSRHPLP